MLPSTRGKGLIRAAYFPRAEWRYPEVKLGRQSSASTMSVVWLFIPHSSIVDRLIVNSINPYFPNSLVIDRTILSTDVLSILEKANHFSPRSLRLAPKWYTSQRSIFYVFTLSGQDHIL